jgi:hypothetical protein
MDLFDFLRVLRRRWVVVVAAVLAGLVAGWVTAPGDTGPEGFRAVHTMIVNPSGGGINLEQAALLATTGAVPQRVGERLGLTGSVVAARVSAEADTTIASLIIAARSDDRALAQDLADLTAEELVVELSGSRVQQYEAELERLESQAAISRTRVAEIQAIPGASDGTDTAAALELQAARSELSSTLSALQAFRVQGAPQPPLQTVELATARPVSADGVQAPDSKPGPGRDARWLGLLLGLGAAFGLDRLDTRIHSKRTAEAAFGHPVVAEIPPLPRGAHHELLTQTRPAAPFVEAYRALRTVVAIGAIGDGPEGEGADRVVLVTSPMAGEGKTTTVAHLAATLGEVDRSVLVISADFRRPRLHTYFGQDQGARL